MSTQEFNTLLLRNTDFLKPFAISLTRDTEQAGDLFQETLYKALSNYDKYNVGTNIRAWLFTIMRNIFINDYRRKSKQRVVYNTDVMTSAGEYASSHPKAFVQNEACNNINMQELKKAIKELPEIYRTPFLLYFDGYKYNEIADALAEPLGTIKSRIHFARKLLKEQVNRF
ncbi:MAG: RNA polymerase sigma factor [Chitinophagaceae bacterium]|nr:RNA polymerase sigma factor [Chitinophagaceae bacterium]MBK8953247.1 RNA polymerase sigma factor [Chitinophagaceae bacterium]